MASGRTADREDPKNSRRSSARSLDRDPISELHQGPRSHAPHREAGHMTAPDHIAKMPQTTLARRGRPHMSFVHDRFGWFATICFWIRALNTGNSAKGWIGPCVNGSLLTSAFFELRRLLVGSAFDTALTCTAGHDAFRPDQVPTKSSHSRCTGPNGFP
jgi:hypothetical protein